MCRSINLPDAYLLHRTVTFAVCQVQVPVVSGETVPDGVRRIEAVTAAGIADTTTGVDVTVGVMDSGVVSARPSCSHQ